MRVVSWNLGVAYGSYRERHDAAWQWIADADPDIALLQECVPPDWARDRWSIVVEPYARWASAILAKRALAVKRVDVTDRPLLARFGSYLATAQLPAGGKPILIGSVHARAAEAPEWVTRGFDRAAIARSSVGVPWSNDVAFAAYRELVEGRPFLIGGDWNTARFVDVAGRPEAAGAEFFERASAAGWCDLTIDAAGKEGRTWFGPGGPRAYQPDHVFVDAATARGLTSWSIEPAPVADLELSDHAPLILDIELGGTR